MVTKALLAKHAKNEMCVLHPLPRVDEIATDVDTGPPCRYQPPSRLASVFKNTHCASFFLFLFVPIMPEFPHECDNSSIWAQNKLRKDEVSIVEMTKSAEWDERVACLSACRPAGGLLPPDAQRHVRPHGVAGARQWRDPATDALILCPSPKNSWRAAITLLCK